MLELFLACQTQWRFTVVAGPGGGEVIWLGLDYTGVEACHRLRGGSWEGAAGRRLWADIQAMEAAALVERNRRQG